MFYERQKQIAFNDRFCQTSALHVTSRPSKLIRICLGLILGLLLPSHGRGEIAPNSAPPGSTDLPPKIELPASVLTLLKNVENLDLKPFPIGFWNYANRPGDFEAMNEKSVADWAAMGCTVAQAPNWNIDDPKAHEHIKDILDWAGANGLKIILPDTRLNGPRFDEAINEFGHHPALFGYHIGDECSIALMMGPISALTQKLQATLPHLHTHYNQYTIRESNLFPGYTSVNQFELDFIAKSKSVLLSYDSYTQLLPRRDFMVPISGEAGWDKYFTYLRIFREVSLRTGVPFWSSICSVSHLRYKIVSYDQLAWQFHSAVCAGANGVEYFLMYQADGDRDGNYRDAPIDIFGQKTKTYYDLKAIHRLFRLKYGDLFTRIVCTRLTFVGRVYGGGQPFTPDEVVSEVEPEKSEFDTNHPLLVGEFVDKSGERYVMVVNNSITDSVRIKSVFPGKQTRILSWDWNGRPYDVPCTPVAGADEIKANDAWLAPGQEIVYHVDSNSARNSPINLPGEP